MKLYKDCETKSITLVTKILHKGKEKKNPASLPFQ